MAIDVIGLLLIIGFFARGYSKGIISSIVSVLAILLGIIFAMKLSGSFANFLLEQKMISSAWAQLVSFIFIFIIITLLVGLLSKIVEVPTGSSALGLISGLAGGIAYMAVGLVFWSCILWIGTGMHLIKPAHIVSSATYVYVSPLASKTFAKVGDMLPMAGPVLGDVQDFYKRIDKAIPTD